MVSISSTLSATELAALLGGQNTLRRVSPCGVEELEISAVSRLRVLIVNYGNTRSEYGWHKA